MLLTLCFFQDDSVDIEDMIKKHEDFEKMIAAQEEKFAALKSSTLVGSDNCNS